MGGIGLWFFLGCGPPTLSPTAPPTRIGTQDFARAADLGLPFFPGASVRSGLCWEAYQHRQPVQQVCSATLHTSSPLPQVKAFYGEHLSPKDSWGKTDSFLSPETGCLWMRETPGQQQWVRLRREGETTIIVLGLCRDPEEP